MSRLFWHLHLTLCSASGSGDCSSHDAARFPQLNSRLGQPKAQAAIQGLVSALSNLGSEQHCTQCAVDQIVQIAKSSSQELKAEKKRMTKEEQKALKAELKSLFKGEKKDSWFSWWQGNASK